MSEQEGDTEGSSSDIYVTEIYKDTRISVMAFNEDRGQYRPVYTIIRKQGSETLLDGGSPFGHTYDSPQDAMKFAMARAKREVDEGRPRLDLAALISREMIVGAVYILMVWLGVLILRLVL
jgi:hypothetical protein